MTRQENGDTERIDTPSHSCWVGEDGVVRFTFLPDTDLNLDFAKAAVESFERIIQNHPRPLLVKLEEAKGMSREARVYFTNVLGPTAVGVVVSSPIGRVISGMFIGLMKRAPYPARAFATEEAAAEWLKGYVK